MDTPAGPFTAVVDHDGAVLASGWTGRVDDLLPLIHVRLRPTAGELSELRTRSELGPVTRAVLAYHEGDLTAPDGVQVRQQAGGAFLAAAWQILRGVAPGSPVSYTELAARTGNPQAVRAAAQACARNAAALFVPCHRVVRADGSTGGFRWGPMVKRWLLTHESVGQANESTGWAMI